MQLNGCFLHLCMLYVKARELARKKIISLFVYIQFLKELQIILLEFHTRNICYLWQNCNISRVTEEIIAIVQSVEVQALFDNGQAVTCDVPNTILHINPPRPDS